MSGEKDRLVITHCNVNADGTLEVDKSKSFTFMLNPFEYNHKFSIDYSQKQEAIGQSATHARFDGAKPEKLEFATWLDGSLARAGADAGDSDVKTQIKALMDIVYKYDGDKHEPSQVRVLWGSQIFFGRLEKISVDRTMFKPSGEPLRAEVRCSFVSSMSTEESNKLANKSSPDMSHLIKVVAGDTLPSLCHRVYKDSSYYLEVAKINNLTDFRDIKPGRNLLFPPLR
ncbi:MAG: nucleoid-associated protein YgaU [Paraglaciecola sp.]|jgi:nucleoid-associated protein YgaU